MYVLINFVCMKTDEIKTEIHPLEPFFPQGARLLMMGSFPPKRERWKMDFYYPNLAYLWIGIFRRQGTFSDGR